MSSFVDTIARAQKFLRDVDVESAIAEFTKALKLAPRPCDKATALRGRSLAMQYLGAQRDDIPKDENILRTALRDAVAAAQLASDYQDVVMSAQWHLDHKATASPGTLRWNRKKAPSLPSGKKNNGPQKPLIGWMEYLQERAPMMVDVAKSDPSILDSLSFPLSVAYAWEQLKLPKAQEVVSIIVLGASSSSEQMVLERTNYWQELRKLLGCSRLRMWFVGPEASDFSIDTAEFTATCHQIAAPYVLRQFLDQHPEVPSTAYVCCFNAGFGNRLPSGATGHLLHSWMPCLRRLANSTRICLFFCANDYADAQGECFVHSMTLGSRFILLPQRNPFGMASVHQNGDEWFQGNAFVYATQYYEEQRRKDILDWATEYAAAHAKGDYLPGLDYAAAILTASDVRSVALHDEPDIRNNPGNASHNGADDASTSSAVDAQGCHSERLEAHAGSVYFSDSSGTSRLTVRDDISGRKHRSLAPVRGSNPATHHTVAPQNNIGHSPTLTVGVKGSGGVHHLSGASSNGIEEPVVLLCRDANLASTVLGKSSDFVGPWNEIEESVVPSCRDANLATAVQGTNSGFMGPCSETEQPVVLPCRDANLATTVPGKSGGSAGPCGKFEEPVVPPCRDANLATTVQGKSGGSAESCSESEQPVVASCRTSEENELFTMRCCVETDDGQVLTLFVPIEYAKSCDVTVDMSSTTLRVAASMYHPFEFAFGAEIDPQTASCKWARKRQGLVFYAQRA